MKLLQGLVCRASKVKKLNIAVLISYNTISDLVEEFYSKTVVEADKIKKGLELYTPKKFNYSNWSKWGNSVENYLFAEFNLRGVPLNYVIRRYEVPETFNFTD